MKFSTLALGAVAVLLYGCASNKQALDYSMGQAEMSQTMSNELNVNATATQKAKADLDSAKVLANDGDNINALVMANMSSLEYRLAMSLKEREDVQKQDDQVEKDLRADMERKAKYQEILEKEVKGGK